MKPLEYIYIRLWWSNGGEGLLETFQKFSKKEVHWELIGFGWYI